jgi:hypothetical protein
VLVRFSKEILLLRLVHLLGLFGLVALVSVTRLDIGHRILLACWKQLRITIVVRYFEVSLILWHAHISDLIQIVVQSTGSRLFVALRFQKFYQAIILALNDTSSICALLKFIL